jgi:hypothetical protein
LSALKELLLPAETGLKLELKEPTYIVASTQVMSILPFHDMFFNSFGSLERLTLAIDKLNDVNQGQLASLVQLKKLHLSSSIRCVDYSLSKF